LTTFLERGSVLLAALFNGKPLELGAGQCGGEQIA